MKILVDAHVFDGKFQGSRTYIRGLYLEMIKLKPEWTFYFAARDTEGLKQVFGNSPNVEYVKLRYSNKYLRLLVDLPRLIRRYKIDYSHFQYIIPPVKWGKYIVTIHDILFEESRFRKYFNKKYIYLNSLLFKRSARRSDIVLTVSNYSKAQINKYYRVPTSRIFVTPNAVSDPGPIPLANSYVEQKFGCEKYILYVSRIEPRKNHLAVVKAFLNLKLYEDGYQLVFVGTADTKNSELNRYVKENSDILEGRLHFFSEVSDGDLLKFYANSEFVIYPSLAEGFGIPPLEAAVLKKPVICSSATAMAEFTFFKHHIDPDDQGAIETAITDLVNTELTNLDETKQTVLDTYSWEKSASILASILEEHASDDVGAEDVP